MVDVSHDEFLDFSKKNCPFYRLIGDHDLDYDPDDDRQLWICVECDAEIRYYYRDRRQNLKHENGWVYSIPPYKRTY